MPSSINFQKECSYLPSSATTVPFCPWKPQAWTLFSILWWFTYDKNEFRAVVWLSREWIYISPTLCTERSQNKFCWLQTMVTWVLFFHRERKVAEYGKKRDSYLLRNCYMPSTILDVLGSLSYMPMKSSPNPVYQPGLSCRTETSLWFGHLEVFNTACNIIGTAERGP